MEPIDSILLHALTGTATDDQLRQLEEWIQADPHNDHMYQALLTYWHEGGQGDAAQLARIWARVVEETLPPARIVPVRRAAGRFWPVAAAVLVLLCSAGLGLYFRYGVQVVHTTAYGTRATVSLADGSAVVLNAGSRLWYRKGWPRRVWLDGEAYFQVAKKPATGARFRVHTGDLDIEVLGTVFNVRTQDSRTEVYLEEGRVKLDFTADETLEDVLMSPGELISYADGAGSYERRLPVPERLTSWKDGSVIMEMAALGDVVDRIAEIHGIRLTVADTALLDRRVTLAFPVEDLAITLEALSGVLGRAIEVQDANEYLIQ
ncbi:MAG: FecR domain-containing protein [Bacteroidia bacterium]